MDVPEDIQQTFYDYILLVTDLTESEHCLKQMSKMLSQICGNGTKLLIGTYWRTIVLGIHTNGNLGYKTSRSLSEIENKFRLALLSKYFDFTTSSTTLYAHKSSEIVILQITRKRFSSYFDDLLSSRRNE
jgi:hypothetical protein